MRGPLAKSGFGAVLALALALAVALPAAGAAASGAAAEAYASETSARSATPAPDAAKKNKKRRGGRRLKRHRRKRNSGTTPAPAAQSVMPRIWATADPPVVHAGDTVTVTVRLAAGDATGIGRHAAFKVGANPALLKYKGYKATGMGALIVEESPRDRGMLVIYRSSLPEGFAAGEALVELEYESLAPGGDTVLLTDVKLLDGRAGSIDVALDHANVEIDH